MQNIEHTMMWRRLDLPGLEAAYFGPTSTGWRLCGTAIFAAGTGPCHLGYAADADERWRLRSGHVFGTSGGALVDVHIVASGDGTWSVGGRRQPDVNGCIDLDLGFTTALRLFTLRRLALDDGLERIAPVAQLRLPERGLRRVKETYLRLNQHDFRFSSSAGGPSTILLVDANLAVLRYPGRWDRDAFPGTGASDASAWTSLHDYQATPSANAEALSAARLRSADR